MRTLEERFPNRAGASASELFGLALRWPNAASLAVRQVTGVVQHTDSPGDRAYLRTITLPAPEPEAPLAIGDISADVVPADYWWGPASLAKALVSHSAARLVLDVRDGQGALPFAADVSVDVVPYHVEANGMLTIGAGFTLRHRREHRDADVAGRPTLYRVTAVNGDPPAGRAIDVVRLHVAIEDASPRARV